MRDKLHAKTLERIFIENRIYQAIEDVANSGDLRRAVRDGLLSFRSKIGRGVKDEDLDALLQMPIRRISRYDLAKAKREMRAMRARLREVKANLDNITGFAIGFLETLIAQYKAQYPRRTEVATFDRVDVREVAQRNLKLRYDKKTGYLGYEVNGNVLMDVSIYNRVHVVRKTGTYALYEAPDRLFVDKGMLFCGFVNSERVFTVIYREKDTHYPCIKRCVLDKFILNRSYELVPPDCRVLKVTTDRNVAVHVSYKPKPRTRIREGVFDIEDYAIRGKTTKGLRLASREVKSAKFVKSKA